MKQIHRMEVEVGYPFYAPKNVTLGWQESRKAFSVWFVSDEPKTATYMIVATGTEFKDASLRQTVIMPDGHHVFHLIQENFT